MEQSRERRGARRYELDLVVALDGFPVESRNLSSTGLYVLSERAYPVGAQVSVEMFFPQLPGRRRRVRGMGKVIRAQEEGLRTGVAVQLLGWAFV